MRVFFDQFLARSDESSVKNEIPFASRFAFRWTIFRATFYAELEKLISLGLSAFRTFRTFHTFRTFRGHGNTGRG